MKKIMLVVVMGLFVYAGCTEVQLRQADEVASAAMDVAGAAETVVNSPAGAVLPPDWRLYISLASALVLAAGNAWQSVRGKRTKAALEEVVAGNEAVKKGAEFSAAHNAAQSAATRQMVAAIRSSLPV